MRRKYPVEMREPFTTKNFDQKDIPELEKVLSEMKRLSGLMKSEVLPALRLLGQSRGHDPNERHGPHKAAAPLLRPDREKAAADYTKSWNLVQADFKSLRGDFLKKLESVPLNFSSALSANLSTFIKNISNPPHIGRAYAISPIELVSDLDSAISRIEIILVDVIEASSK